MSEKKKLLKSIGQSGGLGDSPIKRDFWADETGPVQSARFDGTKALRNARLIPLDNISPDPSQPRKAIDPYRLEELIESISQFGVRQPISVSPAGDDKYIIITGERRWTASKQAGLTEIPAVIVTEQLTDERRMALQLIENIQREDLNPIDRAKAFLELRRLSGKPWKDVEELVGIGESRRIQLMRLLDLPEEIQEKISSGSKADLTEKHARALRKLAFSPEMQKTLFDRIVQEGLSSYDAMAAAKTILNERAAGKPQKVAIEYSSKEDLIGKLRAMLQKLEA